jgi:hypothetical protein
VALGGDGPSAALIAGAQSRHAIFRDELVRRAFTAAEAAHRGQVPDRVPVARICIYSVMVWVWHSKLLKSDGIAFA